jgi:hypothetical protein
MPAPMPFPVCPACGNQFAGAGVWRPRRDATDVAVSFHATEGQCDQVFGVAVDDQNQLELLGSIHDYSDIAPIVNESVLEFDLNPRAK